MDASPSTRPPSDVPSCKDDQVAAGRLFLPRPEASFRPDLPVHRGGGRVIRRTVAQRRSRASRGLTRRPPRWLCSLTTISRATRSGQGALRCGGNRLHSYIRPVRAGLFLLNPMESARPAPHPAKGLMRPEHSASLAGRGLTCLPSRRLAACNFSGGPPLVLCLRLCLSCSQARWPTWFGLYFRSWANKARPCARFCSPALR